MNEVTDIAGFQVSLGQFGRTIQCDDSQGSLMFTFEIAPSPGSGSSNGLMLLDREPLVSVEGKWQLLTDLNPIRVDAALKAAESFLRRCGNEVSIS